jgi:hypothetical protein
MVFEALLPGNGDAVVAVHHEIDLPDLVDFDGRQTLALFHGSLDSRPAVAVFVAARQEGAGELGVPSHAPDNGIQRNILNAAFGAGAQL